MKVLVTGSRGYIGSTLVKTLSQDPNNTVFGIDINPRPEGSTLYGMFSEADINEEIIADIVVEQQYDTIFHLAASADVGDSVRYPELYYFNNIGNTTTLLHHLIKKGWQGKIIFSSTAAVYEEKTMSKVYESSPIGSPNPYGRSKYACEQLIEDVCKAHGISAVIFRYFNVAGGWDDVGDHLNASHIISRMCDAVYNGKDFTLYGKDKMTADKSCVRDYLHVRDVCDAHIHAAKFLDNVPGCHTYNLGTGKGTSNLEMIKAFQRFTGREVNYVVGPDRPGDPDYLVAGADKFVLQTGFRYNHSSLESIVSSAWNYYCNQVEKK